MHSTAADFVNFPTDPMYSAALDGQLSPVGQEYAAYIKAPPTLPSSYWGEANINGEPVAPGTIVSAWVDDAHVGSAVTQLYNGRTVYSLDLPADDPDTPERDGCVIGDIVRFKLGSLNASTTSLWQSGMSVHLDLNRVVYTHAPVPWMIGYGPAAGGWTDQDIFPRMMGDVNGDGKDDIVAFGNRSLYVSLSSGAGFARAVPWIDAYGPAAGGWTSYDIFPRCTGDVNGDGKDDIVAFGNRATYVSLSTGTRFLPATPWIGAYGPAAGGWTTQDRYPRVLGDVNGDGKDDIVAFGENGTFVSLSTGSGFTAPRIWVYAYGRGATGGWWTSFDQHPRIAADVNGDGRDDIIGFGGRATFVSLSTGTGFTAPVEWIFGYGSETSAGGWSSFNLFPRVVSDVNGDGRADVVGFGSGATYVSFANGSRFETPVVWVYNYGTVAGGWTNYNIFPRMTGDVNGDGRQDIVGFGNRATYVSVTNSGNLSASSLVWAALAAPADNLDPWSALVEIQGLPSGPEIQEGDRPADEVQGGWIQEGDPEGVPDGELDQEQPVELPQESELPELLPKEDIGTPRDARDSSRGAAVR